MNAVRVLWDSWEAGDVVADRLSGRFLARPDAGAFAFRGEQFDISGTFTVPRSPQDRPVILQAGVSPQSFVLGDTEAEAVEKYHAVRDEQVTGQTALILLEQIWNRATAPTPADIRHHHRNGPDAGQAVDSVESA